MRRSRAGRVLRSALQALRMQWSAPVSGMHNPDGMHTPKDIRIAGGMHTPKGMHRRQIASTENRGHAQKTEGKCKSQDTHGREGMCGLETLTGGLTAHEVIVECVLSLALSMH